MSSAIWTRCAGDSRVGPFRATPYRAVEAQHQISTRKLVSSDAEQQVLEDLIEGAKPPSPAAPRLHYLLATPFRYPPLPHGSRFGHAHERGIWYAADSVRTVLAETAYYRLLFIEGTAADLGAVESDFTVFRARISTRRGIDLTQGPFESERPIVASPMSYRATQALGAAMREGGVEAFRYPSARDVEGGTNVAALVPSVFTGARPTGIETWHGLARQTGVGFQKRDYFHKRSFWFPRSDFLVDGALPAPAL